MKAFKAAVLAAAAVLIVIGAAQAGRRGSGGWGMGGEYGRMYNTQTVVTLSGEVEKVEKIRPMRGMSRGIHIVLKSGDPCTYTSVHLGPSWYMDNQDIKISKGDKVEVRGSKVEIKDSPAIIASQVTRGDDILLLRDENGVPLWSGWRRR